VTTLALDHLVVAAGTLAEGVACCEQTLGIRPEAGGQHALMGTHNPVFGIASAEFPRAYFEIIAIDPEMPAPGHARWYELDDAALQSALEHGPRLVHWIAHDRSRASPPIRIELACPLGRVTLNAHRTEG
jgi:Glyoxalase-like domain